MRPVRQGDLREANLATVLAAIAGPASPPSRAGVAAATGLTRATVSSLVEVLEGAGLVREDGLTPRAGAGRPSAALALAGDRVAGLGVEIGVDYLAGCVRDLTGAVRAREVLPGDRRGADPERVVAESAALALALHAGARAQGLEVVGATWAVPGLVDDAGCVRLAPNLGWSGVDVAGLLRAAAAGGPLADAPVAVENEATLAAVAEVWRPGAGLAGAPGLLLVSGEVGIGGAAVLGGRLLRGQRGWSGEVGHLTVDPDGPECSCGSTGCLEVYAGTEAVLRAAGLPAATGTSLGQRGVADLLAGAAARGDGAVLAALARAARALGVALAGAVNLLDVDEVVLGGVYAPLAEHLVERVAAEISRRALRSRLEPVRVRRSANGPDAAVLGAAAVVLQDALERPARLVEHTPETPETPEGRR